MEILATKIFSDKLKANTDTSFRLRLKSFITDLERMNDISSIIKSSHVGLDGIYVYRFDNYRLFFSIEEEDRNRKYMLLVDFTKR